MQTSLIITTYNSKTTLSRVLNSYKQQIVMPDEIIIADDGSRDGTDMMIAQMQADYPCSLKHVWQPDNGYRLAQIRNLAVIQSTGDYLIFTDGDCIPHPYFIYDHRLLAERGWLSAAYRIRLSNWATPRFMWRGIYTLPMVPVNRWRHLIRGLRPPVRCEYVYEHLSLPRTTLAGCNFAVFRDDCLAVNGFNEDFIGWGSEDAEFAVRLNKYGIRLKVDRYRAIVFHLRHPEQSKERDEANEIILQRAMDSSEYFCVNGIVKISDTSTNAK